MNSALQCLLHCDGFVQFFLSGRYRADANPQNQFGTKGRLLDAFSTLVQRYWAGDTGPLKPAQILTSLADCAPAFRGFFQQQDAHEFLVFLLDFVHEDLNRAIDKTTGQPIHEAGDAPAEGTAESMWAWYLLRNDSIVVDLFHGLLRSTIVCPECEKETFLFEPFVTLPIAIPLPSQTPTVFTFIPADASKPKLRMTANLRLGSSAVAFAKLIGARIEREVRIVFALHSSRSDSFQWTVSPPLERRGSDLLVFEIPSSAQCYTVASLIVQKQGFWLFDEVIDDFLLVRVPKADCDLHELIEVCNERFAYLWQANDEQLWPPEQTPKIIEIMNELAPRTEEGKFSIEFRPEMTNSRGLPFIARRAIKIRLNPAFLQSHAGFQWSRLLRPTVAVQSEGLASTLENFLRQFNARTILDEGNAWNCPSCHKRVLAEKSTEIWKLPKYLLIQLKRFRLAAGTVYKIGGEVKYAEILDLSDIVRSGPVPQYRLFAVCEHYGTAQFGHYAAHVRVGEKWFLVNDANFKAADAQEVQNDAAYLLFYEQIG